MQALYRNGFFREPTDDQFADNYASRYADVLDRFLGSGSTADQRLLDGTTLVWLYDRIIPVVTEGSGSSRYLPCPRGAPGARRAHCVFVPGRGYCSWFVPIATPGKWVSCLTVDGTLRSGIVPDSRRGLWNPVSGTVEYHYWDDTSVKDLIRRLMLLQTHRDEDGRRTLTKKSREIVQRILVEELMRLARTMRATSVLPLMLADTVRVE